MLLSGPWSLSLHSLQTLHDLASAYLSKLSLHYASLLPFLLVCYLASSSSIPGPFSEPSPLFVLLPHPGLCPGPADYVSSAVTLVASSGKPRAALHRHNTGKMCISVKELRGLLRS